MADNKSMETQVSDQVTTLQFTSFENAKKQLKTFSTRNSGDFGINKVETDGGFLWLGDHKVTGAELNKITSQVQDYLIKLNTFSKDVVNEIGHVYVALESLDKEYIPAIMTAVKEAEIASDQAKTASEHARVAQEDLRETIQKQKKIVGVLEKHKEKLDKLKYLDNIDEIWKESKELEKAMTDFQKKFIDAREQLSNFEKSIKSLQSFANSILDYDHLEDIDEMWERLSSTEQQIELAVAQLSALGESVARIMSIPHLNEMDQIWNGLESGKKEIVDLREDVLSQSSELNVIKSNVQELLEFKKKIEGQRHILDVDESWSDLQRTKEELGDSFSKISNVEKKIELLSNENQQQLRLIQELRSDLEQNKTENNDANIIIKNKLKISYIISGCAVGATILQFILNIIGVL